mmetsp:Transcript_36946/g.116311  ORF Transcript_36946/g.116311 Transcript_36946/m.116311 type:complete len:173 (+) Transcript_36946:117-635(+)
MLGKPATTNFTNRDVVAAMKLLESMHAGNSGGYYMMLEKNPAQAYGRVPEPDYSEVVYAGDTAEAPGPAQPKPDAWSSNLPDLRGLPQPIRAPPPRTEEEQEEEREQEQEEQREAEPPTSQDEAFHPCGRVGMSSDVAEMVLFLADPSRSGFVTGQEFVVDGGVTRKMVYPE